MIRGYKASVVGVMGDSGGYEIGVGPHYASTRVEAEGTDVCVEIKGVPLDEQPRIGDVIKVVVEFPERSEE